MCVFGQAEPLWARRGDAGHAPLCPACFHTTHKPLTDQSNPLLLGSRLKRCHAERQMRKKREYFTINHQCCETSAEPAGLVIFGGKTFLTFAQISVEGEKRMITVIIRWLILQNRHHFLSIIYRCKNVIKKCFLITSANRQLVSKPWSQDLKIKLSTLMPS